MLHHQKERKNLWIINNGYSSHMTRDKINFMNFKEFEGGSATLGNNSIAKISNKGTLTLDGGKAKTHDILYVEGLKHNLLSFNQVCDKEYQLSFSSNGCEVKK